MIKGTIVKRLIRGKERFYHQWRENGKTMSRYLKPDEILPLREKLEEAREEVKSKLKLKEDKKNGDSLFLTGRRLEELSAAISKMKKRALLQSLITHHSSFIILSGAENSGKTVLLQQAIAALSPKDRARAAYLSCPVNFSAKEFMAELSSAYDNGIRIFHLDALERSQAIADLLPSLADTYLPLGCRFLIATRNRSNLSNVSNLSNLSTSPLSFADFALINDSDDLTDYLDSLGLSAQVKALAPPLSPHFGAVARAEAIEKLKTTLSERMLKDVLIREITERRASQTTEVFTLELPHGGMDIVVADAKELTCELYEVKFAAERDDKQLVRLLNSRNLDQIEHRYGMITNREVFYLGRNAWHTSGVYYRNAAKYLLRAD